MSGSDGAPTAPSAFGTGRKLALALLGLLLLLVGGYLVSTSLSGRQVQGKLERLRWAGVPTSLAELAPPPVPDPENAAVLYARAFESLKMGMLPKKLRARPEDDPLYGPGSQPRRATPEALRRALAGKEEALGLAVRASRLPRCRFPVDWEKGAEATLAHLGEVRYLARALGARGYLHSLEGRPREAAEDFAAALRLARHVAEEPILISQLVAYAIVTLTYDWIRRAAETGAPGGGHAALVSAIAETRLERPFERALQGERCFGLWAFDHVRKSPVSWRDELFGGHPEESDWFEHLLSHLPMPPPLLALDERRYLRVMARQIELARKPLRLWPRQGASQIRGRWYTPVSDLVMVDFRSAARKRDEAVARLGLLRWALALDEYQRRAGRYPAGLGELGRAAQDLPQDPFSGRPFVYLGGGGGFLLYSVGPNERDEGGRDTRAEADGLPPEGSDDIGWRAAKVGGSPRA